MRRCILLAVKIRTRRTRRETPENVLDANQVAAHNFRAARLLKGWTQEDTARALAPWLGQELPKASISAIERSVEGDRRRVFNAQELVAFSLGFGLPIAWFLLPPVGGRNYRLAGTSHDLTMLLPLLLGTKEDQDALRARLAEFTKASAGAESAMILEDLAGLPDEMSWEHLENTRQQAIADLALQEGPTIETLVNELRGVLDKFSDFDRQAYRQAFPPKVYRRTSETVLGQRIFEEIMKGHDRQHLILTDVLMSREDLPLEEWIDLDDEDLQTRLHAVYEAIEAQLRTKAIPPPPHTP